MTDNPYQSIARDNEQNNLHSAISDHDWEDFNAVVGGDGPAVQPAHFPPVPDNYLAMRERQRQDSQQVLNDRQNTIPEADYQAILRREFDMTATGGRVNTRAGTIAGRFATLLDNLDMPAADRALYTQRFQAAAGQLSRYQFLTLVSNLAGIQSSFEYGQVPDAAALVTMRQQLRSLLPAVVQPRN